MARFLNRSPKYVLSASVDTLDWQPAALIRGNLREELTTLKGQPGKNIQVPVARGWCAGCCAMGCWMNSASLSVRSWWVPHAPLR